MGSARGSATRGPGGHLPAAYMSPDYHLRWGVPTPGTGAAPPSGRSMAKLANIRAKGHGPIRRRTRGATPGSALLVRFLGTLRGTLVGAILGGLGVSVAAAACGKTNPAGSTNGTTTTPAAAVEEGPPTVRLYLLSTVAGALEPCGCSKDQLGGLDHLASFMAREKASAPNRLLLTAGPLLYLDPKPEASHATQEAWKAETIASAMGDMDLAAWAPGYNDFAEGIQGLAAHANRAGAVLLADTVEGGTGRKLYRVGDVTVGVVGLSEPKGPMGALPREGVTAAPTTPAAQTKAAVAALRAEGAQLLVVMAALPRGAALRIADRVPEVDVLVVGKPMSRGATNTPQPPPQMIGTTLVVETANHAQTVSVVDVFLSGDIDSGADLTLADGGGVARAAKIVGLTRRINELRARITSWEQGGNVDPRDLAARKSDLARIEAERARLEPEPPPPSGPYFRYRVEEVREELGVDEEVVAAMRQYYKRVNAHNKVALADLKPPEPGPDQARYVGAEACGLCHAEPMAVWQKTDHAKAYATLQKGFKEYNLECVGCHVTGYGKAGGSTVTHNADLQNVQCETCHGPGSRHIQNPQDKSLITLKPDPQGCVEACHHPPHVEGFDPVAKMELVLGPGHGK